jgi:exonuclease VII small subunit
MNFSSKMEYKCAHNESQEKMSFTILQDGNELLKLCPKEFRRVYNLSFEENTTTKMIKYLHSDCVCELENGERVHVETVQGLLEDGMYVVKTCPTNLTFPFRLEKKGVESISYLKKIIFMTFPDLPTNDVFRNETLPVNFT